MLPSKDELVSALRTRHSDEVHHILSNSKIGIAGLGGLGSNIAMMLARTGISNMVIADMDHVDISNINRQNYYLGQIGERKTDAAETLLKDINPFMEIKKHHVRLDRSNIEDVFKGCEIVCEAFDLPSEKAMLINTVLERCPVTKVVAGSGMAGYGRSNDIATKKIFDRLYICGDGIDMEDVKGGLMAPRVAICAGHMANTVISLLLKGDP